MKHKPCDEWVEQLTKNERDLPFSEHVALKIHIESCPSCTAAYQEQKNLSELIRTLPAPNFPVGLSTRMLEVMQASPHSIIEPPHLMMSEEILDDDLLQAIAFDVPGVFPRLVNVYHPQLYKFVLSQVQNPQNAEDIMQDCWVRIYQALSRFPAGKIQSLKLRGWLLRIVENQLLMYTDNKNAVNAVSIEGQKSSLEEQRELQPEEVVEIKSRIEEVRAIIEEMPSIYRTTLRMYLLEEARVQEIAVLLGQSAGNVRSIVFHGIRLLRERLTTNIKWRG